jgi:hypothetical protein
MGGITINSIKMYLDACEVIGEAKMSRIMEHLKKQDYYTVTKIFIIQSACRHFKMPVKKLKRSNLRGAWADCKAVTALLLHEYLQCPRGELKNELNYSHETNIDKKIRDMSNLDQKIPYQAGLLTSIQELKGQIENFISTINN